LAKVVLLKNSFSPEPRINLEKNMDEKIIPGDPEFTPLDRIDP